MSKINWLFKVSNYKSALDLILDTIKDVDISGKEKHIKVC